MLFTGGHSPLDYNHDSKNSAQPDERLQRQKTVRNGGYHEWPELEESRLGPVLLRAWKGGYDSPAEALKDVRNLLNKCSKRLSEESQDDIVGIP